MSFSIKNKKIYLATVILFVMQICFFAFNSEYINEKYIKSKREASYLRHVYSSDPYWEKLIQQLEVIKVINETAYKNVLQKTIKNNVVELSSLLSELGSVPKPFQHTVKINTSRLLDNLSAYKYTSTPVISLQDKHVSTKSQFMTKTSMPVPTEMDKVISTKGTETHSTVSPQAKATEETETHSRVAPQGKATKETETHSALAPQAQDTAGEKKDKNNSKLLCHPHYFLFRGRESINDVEHSMSTLQSMFNDTLKGGRWLPKLCDPQQRIAIIIPYRDRDKNLKFLLQNLIPKLRRQMVDYTFYVIEQADGSRFNRGLIRNIGFLEARKEANYDCYIFNDVDTIIENDLNFYTCKPNAAYHMAVRVDRYDYRLLYDQLVGGILSFDADFFWKTNGYSNFFFIWGGEDDAMYQRILAANGTVVRPDYDVTHTTTVTHDRDKKFEERYDMLSQNSHFWEKDGLNTVEYQRIRIEKRKLFTWVYVDIDESKYIEMMQKYNEEWNRLHPTTALVPKKPWPFRRKKSIFTMLEALKKINETLKSGNFPHRREYLHSFR